MRTAESAGALCRQSPGELVGGQRIAALANRLLVLIRPSPLGSGLAIQTPDRARVLAIGKLRKRPLFIASLFRPTEAVATVKPSMTSSGSASSVALRRPRRSGDADAREGGISRSI